MSSEGLWGRISFVARLGFLSGNRTNMLCWATEVKVKILEKTSVSSQKYLTMFQKLKIGHSCAPPAACACISCYLQIVICWQGLCHDTLLTYLLHLLQSCSLFPLQPAHCLLLLLTCQHQQQCILDGLYRLFAFLLWWSRLSERQNKSHTQSYIPHMTLWTHPECISLRRCRFLHCDFFIVCLVRAHAFHIWLG